MTKSDGDKAAEDGNRSRGAAAETEPRSEHDTEIGSENGIETRPEPDTASVTENGTKPGKENETEPGVENGTEPGKENETESDRENGTKSGIGAGMEPGNKPATELVAEQVTGKKACGTDSCLEPGTEQGTGAGTEVTNGADVGDISRPGLRHRAVSGTGDKSPSGAGTRTATTSASPAPQPPANDSIDTTDAADVPHLDTLQATHLLYEALQSADLPRFSVLLTRWSDQPAVISYSHGDGFTCLQYACSQRLEEFVDLLLAAGADPAAASPVTGRTALHWAAAKDSNILQKVIKHAPLSAVNAPDALRCTPLHHAVQAGKPAAIRALLRAGADVSARDDLGQPLLHSLPVDVLKEHLDACVGGKRDLTDTEFAVEFDYALMWPCLPAGQTQFETAAVFHMAESEEHQQLLRHPLVRSFLDLKWWAASWLFIAELAYYAVFLVLLTVLVLLRVDNEALREIWTDFDSVVVDCYWTTVAITLPMIAAKTVQFISAPVRFFFQWDSVLLKMPLMVMTAVYLLKGAHPVTSEGVLDAQLSLAAMLILLAWAQLFVVLSRMPFFAIYAKMYTTVFIRSLWFMFWYAVVIAAFAISMYIVFRDSDSEDRHRYDLSTLGLTLLRTLVMVLDKMDINSLPLERCQRATNNTWTCPPSGDPNAAQLVFVLCLFFVTVVLTNLLNGLAISDTAVLRSHAVTYSLASRARLLAYTESILMDGPLQFLGTVVRPLSDFGACRSSALIRCLTPIGDMFGLRARLARRLGLGRRLPDRRLEVFPNRERQKTSPPLPEYWWLDDDVLETARALVLHRSVGKPDVGRQLSRLERQVERQLSDMGC